MLAFILQKVDKSILLFPFSFPLANELYDAAMAILNQTKQDEKHAYTFLQSAAELGHTEALQKVAWARLLGKHLKQNITQAVEIFESLAMQGNADAQMVGYKVPCPVT